MRRLFLPACLVLIATVPAAWAEDCDRSDDSQSMMNICANADYQAADNILVGGVELGIGRL
ncbi:MAG: hypothetical protein E5W99_21020, partial [Mesorhizobium sp.]